MRKLLFTLLLAVAGGLSMSAQLPLAMTTPADEDHRNYVYDVSRTYQFDLVGGLIFLEGNIAGKKDSFVFDTGAPSLILNNSVRYVTDQNIKAHGIKGEIDVGLSMIKEFKFANKQHKKILAYNTDLQHLESLKKRRIGGLIGYELFKKNEVFIDYDQRKFALLNAKSKRSSFLNRKRKSKVSFRRVGHFPVVKVKIGGKNYYFGIDTGAEINVMDSRLQKKLADHFQKVGDDKYIQGVERGVSKASVARFDKIRLGHQEYKNTEFLFTDVSYLGYGHQFRIDGILGFPFLKKHCLSLNFKKKELWFWEPVPEQGQDDSILANQEVLSD